MKNGFLLYFFALWCGNCLAEIKVFQTTDNTGLNKQERIEAMDKYLVELSTSLKSLDIKLDENSKKIKELADTVKLIRESENKKSEIKIEQKSLGQKDLNEMDKIKADILVLKNQDIEKLKNNLDDLTYTVKAIQATLRDREK